MQPRERFQAVMGFRPFDGLPVVEWADWWDQTLVRWHREGLPAELTDRYAICRHFGLELYQQDWIGVHKPGCPSPPRHGAGIIADAREYDAIRKYLYPRPAVGRARWAEWADAQARGEAVLWFTVDGFFWFPRALLGIEPHLLAFYRQPELLHRINTDLTEWILGVIDEVCAICTPDFMTFAEDMSYNHGPMLSRAHFAEFMQPYYDRVMPRLKHCGVLALVDSDGDISVPATWFEEVGVEGMLPLERQAGVDVARLRAAHPRMRFIGCFDKMTMSRGEAAIRAEFERLLPVAAGGGLIVGCDHQTPPEVSYADYQLYVRLFREYAAEAGRRSRGIAHTSPERERGVTKRR